RKGDKLGVEEIPSLLKEEDESSRAAYFAKGLLVPTNKSFLKSLPSNKIMNLLASCASKMVLLIGDLLERGGPTVEEAQKKEEELEGDMRENERQYEARFTHLRSEGEKIRGPVDEQAGKLQEMFLSLMRKCPESCQRACCMLHLKAWFPQIPEDTMVEDVVPSRVVPAVADDNASPPTAM
ncbi:UNVERIFIED_CONTAM: hypothetical protein Sindi_0966500, partial [Sesamum indicum]